MATRKDVARLAGVSEVTVSRVFNRYTHISQDKKNAVLNAAKQLGYQPNPVAISLTKNATRQLLLLLPERDFDNSFFSVFYSGAAKYAEKAGYMLVVSTDFNFSQIFKKMFDGLIILEGSSLDPGELQEKLQVPAVVAGFGEPTPFPWLENVEIDSGAAMEIMIRYLNEAGHRRIAFAAPRFLVSGETGWQKDEAPQFLAQGGAVSLRYKRYMTLLRGEFGEQLDDYVFNVNDEDAVDISGMAPHNYFRFGRAAAEQIYRKRPDITAVVCYNDEVALGLISRLQGLGVNVPGDLSVTGMDDILRGAYNFPALTTVRLPAVKQSEECVKRLIRSIEGKPPLPPAQLDLEVVSRESVKKINR